MQQINFFYFFFSQAAEKDAEGEKKGVLERLKIIPFFPFLTLSLCKSFRWKKETKKEISYLLCTQTDKHTNKHTTCRDGCCVKSFFPVSSFFLSLLAVDSIEQMIMHANFAPLKLRPYTCTMNMRSCGICTLYASFLSKVHTFNPHRNSSNVFSADASKFYDEDRWNSIGVYLNVRTRNVVSPSRGRTSS